MLPRHRDFRIPAGNVQQGLDLKINHLRIFTGRGNLQHVLAAIGGRHPAVLVPFTVERLKLAFDAEKERAISCRRSAAGMEDQN